MGATAENGNAMQQNLTLAEGSDVVVLFSYQWSRLDAREQAEMAISMGWGDPDTWLESGIWRIPGNAAFGTTSGTLTWSFADVPVDDGEYALVVNALVRSMRGAAGPPEADLSACSLTVLVSPPGK